MGLTQARYARLAPYLPVAWAAPQFGRRYSVSTRRHRWSRHGGLDRVFEQLQREPLVRLKLKAVALNRPGVNGHPDGLGGEMNGDLRRCSRFKKQEARRAVPRMYPHRSHRRCLACL